MQENCITGICRGPCMLPDYCKSWWTVVFAGNQNCTCLFIKNLERGESLTEHHLHVSSMLTSLHTDSGEILKYLIKHTAEIYQIYETKSKVNNCFNIVSIYMNSIISS